MKKKHIYGLIYLAVLLLQTPLVLAHAVITESSLRKQPIPPSIPVSIALSFNSGIELPLSRFFLVNQGNNRQCLAVKNGSNPGQVIVAIPALPTGRYALLYKVFAADGHVTKNILHLTVPQIR